QWDSPDASWPPPPAPVSQLPFPHLIKDLFGFTTIRHLVLLHIKNLTDPPDLYSSRTCTPPGPVLIQDFYSSRTCTPPGPVLLQDLYSSRSPPGPVLLQDFYSSRTCTHPGLLLLQVLEEYRSWRTFTPPGPVLLQYLYSSRTCTPPVSVLIQDLYSSRTFTPPVPVLLQDLYSSSTCTPPGPVLLQYLYSSMTCVLPSSATIFPFPPSPTDCVEAHKVCSAEPQSEAAVSPLGEQVAAECLEGQDALLAKHPALLACKCQRGFRKEEQCLHIYWRVRLMPASSYMQLDSENQCLKAAQDCGLYEKCGALRSEYVLACTKRVSMTSRCNQHKCHRALRRFLERVPEEYSLGVLFCPCTNTLCGERRRKDHRALLLLPGP
ncbi:hypothetical protein KUCAC02_016576, partial [Chaenocephalus aceratus]